MDSLDSDDLYSDKSSNKNSNSERDINYKKREREKEKEKIKKNKIQNNIRTYKEDSSTSNDDDDDDDNDNNNDNNNKENENYESSNVKDILKIKNTSYNYSHYKIRHTNNISLGTSLNRPINNFFVKTPKFRVVEPENLISLEFDRAYERNKKNNNFMCNNFDDNLNETNIREDINDKNVAKINKTKKSYFCCL